jgi:hypothetical protein
MERQSAQGGTDQVAANSNPIDTNQTDYSKPVAYDTQGRPLYLRPEDVAAANTADASASPTGWSPAFDPASHGNHQYVHVSRPIAPADVPIPDEIMKRYEESRRNFSQLNLSKGEYIISAIKRHPFGLLQIWGVAIVFIVALASLLVSFVTSSNMDSDFLVLAAAGLGLVSFFVFAGALIATYIYNCNRFYLTNESVIQEIQIGLFNKHEQTVSLANIEDASFYKAGIFSYFFDFGTIRLSTEGDETTYRFSYVAHPKRQIAILNNAVEAFKNGRPIEPPNDDQAS